MTRKIVRDTLSDLDNNDVVNSETTEALPVSKVDRGEMKLKQKPSIDEMLDHVRKVYRKSNAIDYKLHVPEEVWEEGYHYHYINDKRSRILEKQAMGYEIVRDLDGKAIRKVVNSSKSAEFSDAVLMKIPQVVYDEIQKLRQQSITSEYQKLMRSNFNGDNSGKVRYSESVEN